MRVEHRFQLAPSSMSRWCAPTSGLKREFPLITLPVLILVMADITGWIGARLAR